MTAGPLESNARELLGQLRPEKLAAVVHLLEVMVHEEDISDEDGDTLSLAEAKTIAEAEEWNGHNNPSRTNKSSPSSACRWPIGRG